MRSELGEEIGKRHEQNILLRLDVLNKSLARADKAAQTMTATSANTDKVVVTIEPAPYLEIAGSAVNSVQEIDLNSAAEIDGVIYMKDIREQLDRIYAEIPQEALNNLRKAS
jgi:hypothetical protein